MKLLLIVLATFAALFLGKIVLNSYQSQDATLDAGLDYTFYVFERELPATVCKDPQTTCKSKFMNNYQGQPFTLHGLWPTGSPSDGCAKPQSCTKQTYKESLLEKSLLDQMNINYVGLYSSATGFRGHEFKKHGSCYQGADSLGQSELENSYFGKIQELNSEFDLESALKSNNVVPDNSRQYNFNDIEEAVKTMANGAQPLLRCIYLNKVQFLASIQIYLDRDFQPIDTMCVKPKASHFLQGGQGHQPCNPKKLISYPEWSNDLLSN